MTTQNREYCFQCSPDGKYTIDGVCEVCKEINDRSDILTCNECAGLSDEEKKKCPHPGYEPEPEYVQIIQALKEGFDDDIDTDTLQKAAEYFCSPWDIREGYKHALTETLYDQYSNHADEQDPNDLVKLKQILKL